ncbi:right-handed parallel beta-helix repeat-containing protein [Peribacillus sp. YIM B13472]|uniref:right-handed parallel beta-helix repeat-containing protein n=1 Tax=Peribacillus sp. YIM B13472 TaxID=3366297 RepID=UPI003670FC5E
MERRNFLVNILLWMLTFFFGFTIKKEGDILNLSKTDARMVLDRDGKNISDKIGNLNEQLADTTAKVTYMTALITPSTSIADRQNILNSGYHVTFASGDYSIDQVMNITKSDTKVTFIPGVTFTVNTAIDYIFRLNANLKNIEIYGSNTTINLNNKANGLLTSAKNTIKQDNYIIKGFKVMNNDVPYKFTAVLYLKNVKNFVIESFSVDNYSRMVTQSTSAYCIGLFDCEDGYMSKISLGKSYIGILTHNVYNINLSKFSISNMLDNGVYLLENINDASAGVSLTNGLIEQCEEGIVNYLTDLTIDDVTIKRNTNKGVSLRKGLNVTISKCTFRDNNTDIGDDNSYNIYDNKIINNNFYNSKINSINLSRVSRSKIKDNLFKSDVITGTMVRIVDESSQGNENEVSYNRFDSTNQSITLLGITGYYSGVSDNLIAYNRFINAGVGIKLLRSGGTGLNATKLSKNMYSNVGRKKLIGAGITLVDEDFA